MFYEVRLSDGFGEPMIVAVTVDGGFTRAIEVALERFEDEREFTEITCVRKGEGRYRNEKGSDWNEQNYKLYPR